MANAQTININQSISVTQIIGRYLNLFGGPVITGIGAILGIFVGLPFIGSIVAGLGVATVCAGNAARDKKWLYEPSRNFLFKPKHFLWLGAGALAGWGFCAGMERNANADLQRVSSFEKSLEPQIQNLQHGKITPGELGIYLKDNLALVSSNGNRRDPMQVIAVDFMEIGSRRMSASAKAETITHNLSNVRAVIAASKNDCVISMKAAAIPFGKLRP